MERVLCFGDSNTYGYKPDGSGRYPEDIRWTGLLTDKCKNKNIQIIEEGLVGRTTVFEDSVRQGRKGIDFLLPIIETHSPLNKIVLMLGTNDCKTIYKASSHVIGLGVERLINIIKDYSDDIDILLVSPIALGDHVFEEGFDQEFNEEAIGKSKELKEVYRQIANRYGCSFLAASDYAKPSEIDQEHLDKEGHRALADAIYDKFFE